MFTPHARGSTGREVLQVQRMGVYPACAGIDPKNLWKLIFILSLPRMRGDRPLLLFHRPVSTEFTPHARGSTPPPLAKICL